MGLVLLILPFSIHRTTNMDHEINSIWIWPDKVIVRQVSIKSWLGDNTMHCMSRLLLEIGIPSDHYQED